MCRKLDVELDEGIVVDANVLVVVLVHFDCPIERCRARCCAVCVFFFKVAPRAVFHNFFAIVN